MSNIIKEKRLRWLGHVFRMNTDRFSRQVFKWKPGGKKKRGRPKLSWKEIVSKDLKAIDMSLFKAEEAAQDRKRWKMVTALCAKSTGRTKV